MMRYLALNMKRLENIIRIIKMGRPPKGMEKKEWIGMIKKEMIEASKEQNRPLYLFKAKENQNEVQVSTFCGDDG